MSRKHHLQQVAKMIEEMEGLVFTLGLTEQWVDGGSGRVLPTAPGVLAGRFDDSCISFVNASYNDVVEALSRTINMIRSVNSNVRFLLTVSPVPLAATATGVHVVQATQYSKAVLRAAAGYLSSVLDYVDYFPSYEIVTNNHGPEYFYEDDRRSVSPRGVSLVMEQLFGDWEAPKSIQLGSTIPGGMEDAREETECEGVICDEDHI